MAHADIITIAVKWQMERASIKWRARGAHLENESVPTGEISLGHVVEDSGRTPTDLRDQFLSVEQSDGAEALAKFLNETGDWDGETTSLSADYFWQEQEVVRAIMTSRKFKGHSPADLLREALGDIDVRLDNVDIPERGAPTMLMSIRDTRSAIYLSLWSDKARNAKYRFCARRDCPEHRAGTVPFEVQRRDQVYCQQYCAHVASQRQKRTEERRRKKGR